MSRPDSLTLLAPLAGWSTPLAEAPDEVFAARMLGDGVAIDPTAGTLHAPCDGVVVVLPPSRHAVTLRSSGGCEILMHVGIDTVALGGQGFEAHTRQGATVRAGDALLTFDLDLIAQRARSALTPVIVTSGNGFRIVRRVLDREVAVGDSLLELLFEPSVPAVPAAPAAPAAGAEVAVWRVRVGFEHGVHARPAALLAGSLKALAADVRLTAHGREANARSTVALMALGMQRGEEVEIRAAGPDAAQAIAVLSAALGADAAAAATPGVLTMPRAAAVSEPGRLRGVTASAGVAVGKVLQLRRPEIDVTESGAGAAQENAALDRARLTVRARLEQRASPATAGYEPGAGTGAGGTAAAREIAAAHLELLDDPELIALARTRMAAGKSAAFAWRTAVRESATALAALTDPRLRERVDDLLDLESQVLLALEGAAAHALPELPPEAILIARELLPSQLAALENAPVAGICMAEGGPTSHAAILAAAMGIPALVALGPQVLAVSDGTEVVLDAGRGLLEIDPGAARLAMVRAELAAHAAQRTALEAAAQRECRTADGTRIEVLANIGSLAEARAALRSGAEGCGLLRTEFLFLGRQVPPSAAEQSAEYQRIADVLAGRPLTIRTLDAGGDKPIPYLPLAPEENPALGLRGVRTSLAYPQLLREQLRAVLAVRPSGQCRLLLPMISDVGEIHTVRTLLDEVRSELGMREAISVGVMIETPASAVLADRMARVADFLSIGTNDLTQYTLAMDRGHPQLAARLDALHPAVLRLIARTVEAARAQGRHVAVCGGLASDPVAAPLLVGLGVQELSAVPAVIPQLKARIASVSLAACRALAQRALEQPDAAGVRALAAQLSPAAAAVCT